MEPSAVLSPSSIFKQCFWKKKHEKKELLLSKKTVPSKFAKTEVFVKIFGNVKVTSTQQKNGL